MRNRPFFLRRRSPAGRRAGPAAGGVPNPWLVDLVSHWRLEDEADAHGGRTLTNNGTATFGAGKIGNAAYFNGTNQYLSRADDAGLSMSGQTSFTLACWLYLTDKTADRWAVLKGDSLTAGTSDYGINYATTADRIQFAIGDGSNGAVATADTFGAVPADTWVCVVAWYDRATGTSTDTVNIQVDGGTADSAASGANGSRDGTRQLDIGRGFNTLGSSFWAGRVDSVSIWKRLLTAAERTALYNGGAGRDYPFL